MTTTTPPHAGATAPWSALARAHADQMTAGALPHRLAVIGTAGGGKSSLLRHLRECLESSGAQVVLFRADEPEFPDNTVVMVDDAHLLDRTTLERVRDHAANPESGLVVACRPWPHHPELAEVLDVLGRAQPTIVLGHIGREEARAILSDARLVTADGCIDDLVEQAGGIPWLLIESLSAHADLLEDHDTAHPLLGESLQDAIAHRVRMLDPDLRTAIETLCLLPGATGNAESADVVDAGHAAGLLTRNGQPAPLVCAAVRATTPVDRLIEVATSDGGGDSTFAVALRGVRDPRLADALLTHAERVSSLQPRRADETFRAAADAGADPVIVAVRRAELAWHRGDVDAACAILEAETIPADHPERERAADIVASAWAARALIATSDAIYRSTPIDSVDVDAHRIIAAAAVGEPEDPADAVIPPATTIPSTVSVAMELLVRGLRSSLTQEATTALHDLVRASETYSVVSTVAPTPELPAVIAAQAAIGVGDVEVAESILRGAVEGRHGGGWARHRLMLWRAWTALQRQHPRDVEHALATLDTGHGGIAIHSDDALTPRDRLLADAIRIALARRYSDTAGLTAAWHRARETTLRAEFDLFTALPLGEFVTAAARLGDTTRVQAHYERALARVEALGSPPIWSAHLHWAGIQQGIFLNTPALLTPHARALVAASAHSRLASRMAHGGRVWTSVMTGDVDVDLVEEAAQGLAAVGLAWDGARLAGQGASRSENRRDIARLLACARHLHPRDVVTADASSEDLAVAAAPAPRADAQTQLSAREREVAVLVLQGKTYAEIGETIYISPRTAEHHIARIRRRLGATTRSDLIAKLRFVLEVDAVPDTATGPQPQVVS